MSRPGPARRRRDGERGIALLMTMLLAITVAALAFAAVQLSSSANLVTRWQAASAQADAIAEAGLDWARDSMNAANITLPLNGRVVLEDSAPVSTAGNATIPGLRRTVVAGRSGNVSGQFGIFGSVLSMVYDQRGLVAVRRLQLGQETFAKFAEFIDTMPVCVAAGAVRSGPVHSNDNYFLCAGGPATFNGPVTTSRTVTNRSAGVFLAGVRENVSRIRMPSPTALDTLEDLAQPSGYVIDEGATYDTTRRDPGMRLEFVAVDIDEDGRFDGANEGFFRIIRPRDPAVAQQRAYVLGRRWDQQTHGVTGDDFLFTGPRYRDPNRGSPNCGVMLPANPPAEPLPRFRTAADTNPYNAVLDPSGGLANPGLNRAQNLLNDSRSICYLGGDARLTDGFEAQPDTLAAWAEYPGWGGNAPSAIVNKPLSDYAGSRTTATSARYLWPLSRAFNLNYVGLLFINGSVAISGQFRGQATLVATGNITFVDNLTYVTPPSTTCADILGLIAYGGMYAADNNLTAPFRVTSGSPSAGRYRVRNPPGLTVNGVLLTLGALGAEAVGNNRMGPQGVVTVADNRRQVAVSCNGQPRGRGCFSVLGGVIMKLAGGLGRDPGQGWLSARAWDTCTQRTAPPYFPTTAVWTKNRYFELDPTGFDAAAWFTANQ
ncbi:MAG: hypothetical protein NW201_04790 [Gemmatimonadales bacterium]|nr:hypothetical protein [Gemmatimonadales bacterium]